MKKTLLIMGVVLILAACNTNEGAADNTDPNEVHPVSEAIPDSTKLVNDSVVVPDTVPAKGSAGLTDDSTKH